MVNTPELKVAVIDLGHIGRTLTKNLITGNRAVIVANRNPLPGIGAVWGAGSERAPNYGHCRLPDDSKQSAQHHSQRTASGISDELSGRVDQPASISKVLTCAR